MLKRLAIVLLLLPVLALPAAAQTFEDGVAAYKRKDYATAFRVFERLALQRHANAQLMLGTLYWKGYGVPKNNIKGRQWVEKSAQQGNAKAQFLLAVLYYYGAKVPKDYVKARNWAEKSARQGYSGGQFELGVMHEDGHAVPKNDVLAYMWYSIAVASGGAPAKRAEKRLDRIAKRMTPQQIAEAQALAAKCWKKPATCP